MVAVLGAALAVTAAPAGASGDVVTEVSEADRDAAVSYWTPERIEALSSEDRLAPAEKIGTEWEGAPPPGLGRLFYTSTPGGDGSCTATVVPSSSKDVAFTAGHCVNGGLTPDDTPIEITNVVFAPAFDDGKAPHGLFPVRAYAWPDTYGGPMASADDDAVLAVDPVDGKHVQDLVGTQDISFDEVPSPVDSTIVGYPASKLTRGKSPVSCELPATFESNSVYSSWTSDCDMAGGSSGGPWLRDVDPATGKGTIFSVTSKGTTNPDGTTEDLNAAAFTDAVRGLYERAGDL
ncbi:hypothetical protein JHE00_26075 [Prauserella sp. ASG 168]|uniref:Peptidase S1 domain-containing protein n=2 Tax=Prauserella cavernicola TaxID=2800127 RepID=A0A934V3Z0_9PSEU|nr:hypothetical protein [Prauserella cavernicola]